MRNLRRLISFLLREAQAGKTVNLDIYPIMQKLKAKTLELIPTEKLTDYVNFPELRFVSVIATVQKSNLSEKQEGKYVFQIFEDTSLVEHIMCRMKTLSSNQTLRRGYTHRFQIDIILDNICKEANEYVDLVLCRNTLDDKGKRLFFRLS